MNQRFVNIRSQLRAIPQFPKWTHFDVAKAITRNAVQEFGDTQAPDNFGALVAFPGSNGQPYLYEFAPPRLQPEFKTPELWWVTMGSGQPIADPFMGLLSRVFFKRSRPLLSEGIFAALWTLNHAIDVNPGGIQGPPRIGVLKATDANWTASLIADEDLEEHIDSIKAAEEHLAAYRKVLSGEGAPPPPPPPPPPPA